MGYLEQFARNQRRKEQTEVLTARLPRSLYNDFKTRCDELGLSISEAVYLLVEREMKGLDSVSDEPATTIEYKMNDDVVATNTNVIKKNTRRANRIQKDLQRYNGKSMVSYLVRFVVNGRLQKTFRDMQKCTE